MLLPKVLLLLLVVTQHGALELSERVQYEEPRCAVKRSTVTLPCTFSPLNTIIRVRWCINHEICQLTTPSVYDSQSPDVQSRYRYLGDKTGNCTLQIRQVELQDNATFRFRMEAQDVKSHITGVQGVIVRVTGSPRMRISSSRGDSTVGDTIVLNCSTDCTFHDMPITWRKNNLTIPGETGPSLTLGPLTEDNTGIYSCGLKDFFWTNSNNFTLQLTSADESGALLPLVLGVLAGVLLVVGTVVLVFLTIRRKQSSVNTPREECKKETDPELLYNSIATVRQLKGERRRKADEEESEVAYAAVQFKPTSSAATTTESVIYSSVATQR